MRQRFKEKKTERSYLSFKKEYECLWIGGKIFAGKPFYQWHSILWSWLAKNPDKEKKDWIELQDFSKKELKDLKRYNICFACLEVKYNNLFFDCKFCCLEVDKGVLCEDEGLYDKWWEAEDLEERAKYAKQIANLDWVEKYKE